MRALSGDDVCIYRNASIALEVLEEKQFSSLSSNVTVRLRALTEFEIAFANEIASNTYPSISKRLQAMNQFPQLKKMGHEGIKSRIDFLMFKSNRK